MNNINQNVIFASYYPAMKKLNSVLLIDDEPISNIISHSVITKLDIAKEITLRDNGASALEFIEEYYSKNRSFPELIIVDVNMPVMNGIEFLEAIEFILYKSKTLIVVLSNLFHESDLPLLNKINPSYCLIKPLENNLVLSLIQKHFDL